MSIFRYHIKSSFKDTNIHTDPSCQLIYYENLEYYGKIGLKKPVMLIEIKNTS